MESVTLPAGSITQAALGGRQLPRQLGQGGGRLGALGRRLLQRVRAQVVGHHLVPALEQALGHVGAHLAQADHADPHARSSRLCVPAQKVAALSRQRLQQLVEGLGEGVHALVLERLLHVEHVDAGLGQAGQGGRSRVGIGVDGPLQRPVVLEGAQGRLGHGVDGGRPDQAVHVEQVGVARVLGRGGGPQRPLHPGALGPQRLPALAGEGVVEVLVGRLGLGHRGGAPQAEDGGVALLAAGQGLQAAVDLGVDPADEEGGHAGHPGQLGLASGRHQRLEAAAGRPPSPRRSGRARRSA